MSSDGKCTYSVDSTKPIKTRKQLCHKLDDVIELCEQKSINHNTKPSEKLQYISRQLAALDSYARIIKDMNDEQLLRDTAEIKTRLDVLEGKAQATENAHKTPGVTVNQDY